MVETQGGWACVGQEWQHILPLNPMTPLTPESPIQVSLVLYLLNSGPIGASKVLHRVREQMLSYLKETPMTILAPQDMVAAISALLYLVAPGQLRIGLPVSFFCTFFTATMSFIF